jgi:hypothetical protein
MERSSRDRLLATAEAASGFDEPGRRFAVLGLIKDRWRSFGATCPKPPLICTEGEIFTLSYGDPSGSKYWLAWLFEPLQKSELANTIAAATTTSPCEWDLHYRRLMQALAARPDPCTRDDVEWLMKNPNTTHLIPASLREFLMPEPTTPAKTETIVDTPKPGALKKDITDLYKVRLNKFIAEHNRSPSRAEDHAWAREIGITQDTVNKLRLIHLPDDVRRGGRGAGQKAAAHTAATRLLAVRQTPEGK